MGRNWVPKFGEWRDGELHEIVAGDGSLYPKPDDGRQVVYRVTTMTSGGRTTETLAVAWADGLLDLLACFWKSGFDKGRKAGREEALREVRASLGITT
jgi:hypothetical protein